MKTHQTIAGNAYVVYSKEGCTVTDSTGTLNKEVPAGDFLTIPAPSDALITSDDNALVRKANFKRAALALGLLGGGDNGLPAGYTRVEYLDGGGAKPYIDTQLIVPYTYTWRIVAQATGDASSLCGWVVWNTQGVFISSYARSKLRAYVAGTWHGDIAGTWNKKQTISWERASGNACILTTNDRRLDLRVDVNYTPPRSVYLFHANGEGNYPAFFKIWEYVVYDEAGKLKMHLVPTIDKTGTPCMFDLVTRNPFYNSGTGDFLYPGKEEEATTYSLRRPRMYAQMTEHGIRRLYHVPKGYNGTPEEYAEQNGFKVLVETPQPEEGYWTPVWHEREDCIELEWVETEPETEPEILTAE